MEKHNKIYLRFPSIMNLPKTDLQKANMLNKYFSSQSVVDDNNKTLPRPKAVLHDRLEILEITPQAVKDVFDGLNINKSCSPDLMSPPLLKEGSSVLAEPFCIIHILSPPRTFSISMEGWQCNSPT